MTDVEFATGMDRAAVAGRLLEHMRAGSTYYADGVFRQSAKAYTDPDRFRAEVDTYFRHSPMWVAWTAELPNPGDYKAVDIAGIPLVFIRGKDGIVRGFRNTCAHRGAKLVDGGRGRLGRRVLCQYHEWGYDYESGALCAVPYSEGFSGLDRSTRGLTPLPVQEKYGLIFACADPNVDFDLDEHLAGLGRDFAFWKWEDWEAGRVHAVSAKTNYKLAVDSGAEAYHFSFVHRDSLPGAIPNTMDIEFFGDHARMVFPFPTLEELRGKDKAELAKAVVGKHLFMAYLIFPNILIVNSDLGASIFQTLPGAAVGECTNIDHQIFKPGIDPGVRAMVEEWMIRNFTIVETEDYPVVEGVYASLAAGSLSEVVFGRNEAVLHRIHERHNKHAF